LYGARLKAATRGEDGAMSSEGLRIALEPIDRLRVTILMDNLTDWRLHKKT
jgi:hypothetical protein